MGSYGDADAELEAKYGWPDLPNTAAPGAPFYTPIQDPPAGTARDPERAAALFKPLQIRGLKLQNRIFVRHARSLIVYLLTS